MGSDLLSTTSLTRVVCVAKLFGQIVDGWMCVVGLKKVLEEDFLDCETDDTVWAEMGPKHFVLSWQQWILHL